MESKPIIFLIVAQMEEKWHTLGRCFLESESDLGIIFRQDSHRKEKKLIPKNSNKVYPITFMAKISTIFFAYLPSYFFLIKKNTTPKKNAVPLHLQNLRVSQQETPITFDS